MRARADRPRTTVWGVLLALWSAGCGGVEFTSGEPMVDGGAGASAESGAGGSGGEAGSTGGSGGGRAGSAGAGGLTQTGGSAGRAGGDSDGGQRDGSSGAAGQRDGAGGAGGQRDGAGGRVPVQHRASADACDNERPPSTPVPTTDAGNFACHSDADCTAGRNGRCGFSRIGLECSYDRCFADSDCASSDAGSVTAVCKCGGAASNVCTPAGCRTDVDCPGSYCSPTFGSCGNYSGVVRYECHTSRDECVDDADCTDAGSLGFGSYCAFAPAVGYWKCSSTQCAG